VCTVFIVDRPVSKTLEQSGYFEKAMKISVIYSVFAIDLGQKTPLVPGFALEGRLLPGPTFRCLYVIDNPTQESVSQSYTYNDDSPYCRLQYLLACRTLHATLNTATGRFLWSIR